MVGQKRKRSRSVPRKAFKVAFAAPTQGQPSRFRAYADSLKRKRTRRGVRRAGMSRSRSSGNSLGPETSVATSGIAKLPLFVGKLLKQTPPSYLYANAGGLSTGTPGVQALSTLGANFGNGDLAKCFAIGSQATGSMTGGSTSRSYPLYHKNVYRLKNQYDEDAYCVIYDCVPKRDTSVTPFTCWQAGYTGAQGTTTMSSSFVGAKPMQSEYFKSMWKIVKTTKFMLAPGAQHLHTTVARGNKVLSDEILVPGLNYLKGWSMYSILVVYGGPADSGGSSAVGTVSTGSNRVIWVQDTAISFKIIEQNSTNFNQVNILPPTIATETTLLEAIGAVQGGAGA